MANRRTSSRPRTSAPAGVPRGTKRQGGRASAPGAAELPRLRARIADLEREVEDAQNRLASIQTVLTAERRQTRLLRASRLSALGTLASGISHEVNNPLACVLSNVEFAYRRVFDQGTAPSGADGLVEVGEALAEAVQGTKRARDVLRDLVRFAAAEEESAEAVALGPVIESAVAGAWPEVRQRARLEWEIAEVPPVEANADVLEHILAGLLLNAAQAVPAGDPERHEVSVTVYPRREGFVTVEVRDTGMGIPSDVLVRLFDPFFTTKPLGGGRGLGLSVVHGVVRALGGCVEVDSDVGRGTRVRLDLPVARGVTSAASPNARSRILIVDTDSDVARVVRRTLGAEHEVVVHPDPRDALDWLAGAKDVDVVLCDLLMTEPAGAEFHAALARDAPDLASRVVFLTTGAATGAARVFLDRVKTPRLDKPLDADALREVVRNLLE